MLNERRLFVVRAGLPVGALALALALPVAAQSPTDGQLEGLSLEEILNIKVSVASKSDERISDAPGVIVVITRDELRRFGGTTLKDVLQRAAGLIGSSVFMTDRSTIAARGDQIQPSSSHVLFLLNGRPVREILEGGIKSELYETFPVDIVERIEIIKGPGSVLYGSHAFSAVINVITEAADKTGFSVRALAGDGGAYGSSGTAKIKVGDLAVVMAGSYRKKADWDANYLMRDPATQLVGNHPITIPNKGPGAFLDVSFKNLRLMSAFNRWDNAYFLPPSDLGGAHWEKRFANLGYGQAVNHKWRTDVNVTFTRSLFAVTAFPNISRDSHEIVAEWSNVITPTAKASLTFGGLFNRIKGGEIFSGLGFPIPISNAERDSYAFYTQVDYQVHHQLNVIGGLQVNKTQKVDAGIVPRGGLIWHPAPRWSIKALYSEAFRSPSINELSLDHPQLKGNPGLEPEHVGTVDLGVGYQGGRAQAGINYFIGKQTKIIIQDRTQAIPRYENFGEADIQGFEAETKYYVNPEVYLSGSILYQKSKDGLGNEHLTPIAGFGAKTAVSYRSENGITLSLSEMYQGDLDPKFNTQINPSPKSYHRVDLHGRLNVNKVFHLQQKAQVEFFVQGDNLLGREIWLPAWGLVRGDSMPYDRGRALYVGLDLSR